jgi:hypothetical protein
MLVQWVTSCRMRTTRNMPVNLRNSSIEIVMLVDLIDDSCYVELHGTRRFVTRKAEAASVVEPEAQ